MPDAKFLRIFLMKKKIILESSNLLYLQTNLYVCWDNFSLSLCPFSQNQTAAILFLNPSIPHLLEPELIFNLRYQSPQNIWNPKTRGASILQRSRPSSFCSLYTNLNFKLLDIYKLILFTAKFMFSYTQNIFPTSFLFFAFF